MSILAECSGVRPHSICRKPDGYGRLARSTSLIVFLTSIRKLSQEGKTASYDNLMIVAHPDDETIFGGAQLIREDGWLVVCVTNGDNKVRRKEFTQVMNEVNAEFEMWAFKDRWKGDFDRPRLRSELARLLSRKPVRKVVTHNLQGEYGHTQHIALAELVRELADRDLFVFDRSDRKLDKDILAMKQIFLERMAEAVPRRAAERPLETFSLTSQLRVIIICIDNRYQ